MPSGGHAAVAKFGRGRLLEEFKRQVLSASRNGDGEASLFGTDGAHGGGHKDVYLAQAPSAVEILGASTEGIGGTVVASTLGGALAATVAVQRRDDRRLVIRRYGAGEPETVSLSLDDFYGTAALLPLETLQGLFADGRHWAADIAGAFPVLARHKNMTRRTNGANIACLASPEVDGTAVACATLSALTAAYHLLIEPAETALLAQKIRHTIAGDPCGVWAPMASTLCPERSVIAIRCQPHEVAAQIRMPDGWRIAGIRLQGRDDGGGAHGSSCQRERTAAVIVQALLARAIKDLGIRKGPAGGYLANASDEHFHRYFERLMPESISGREFLEQYGPPTDWLARVRPDADYSPRADAARLFAQSGRAKAFAERLAAGARAADASARSTAMVGARTLLAAGAAGEAALTAMLIPDDTQGQSELTALAAELRKRSGEREVVFEEAGAGSAEAPALRVPLAELLSS